MRRVIEILGSSLNLTWQEFKSHKLRTLLSLSGVGFGILCIIGVLATVNSLEYAVQQDIKALGSNTIYIDKWDYSAGGNDYPWWKYVNRPTPKYDEVELLKQKVPAIGYIAFNNNINAPIEYNGSVLTGLNYYGVSADFDKLQPVEVGEGRYFQQMEFEQGTGVIVLGYLVAENLFGSDVKKGIGQELKLKDGKRAVVVGILKKKGKSIIGGWDYDNNVLITRNFMKTMAKEEYTNPSILVSGKEHIPLEQLKDELLGAMRSIRKLKPTQEDNFSLNDINTLSGFATSIFDGVNKGGWAIATLSLIVGMFGVANIMFVTVRERTSQIGLKKAIGAKRITIMTEFLLESSFLCIMGGLLGLLVVVILTFVLSAIFGFSVFIAPGIIMLAISICIVVGVLAGIIPASIAARMDPVVAIRSK
ncbi:ABC transporter permease [Pseudoflavitalea rhizosphaerae]|uniref:ABC transporter permease n=1 Tax=Pseudoflavitalea rhizosphaerae TaxID=1884793 RepID=UPI000F8C6E96|nr:ABC transporter permease [Pseudoflavitalea rhizosphaerae]